MKRLIFILTCFVTLLVQAQMPVNKREVMQRFLSGTLDASYVPAAFFMHFGKDARTGENAINAHLRYFLSSDMDFVKIQFEQGYGRIRIEKAEDWEQIKPLPEDFFAPTLEVVQVLRHFWGNPICKTPLSMDYASLFEGINIQCYKMELKKM